MRRIDKQHVSEYTAYPGYGYAGTPMTGYTLVCLADGAQLTMDHPPSKAEVEAFIQACKEVAP